MSDSLPESLMPSTPPDFSGMEERPRVVAAHGRGTRLAGQIALVSDGASALGQAVAVSLAREGAQVVIAWLNEPEGAAQTMALIAAEGRQCLSVPGDIGNPDFAAELVRQTVAEFGRIDVLVNNAAERHGCADFVDITDAQIDRVFRTNVFGQFWLTRAALPHMADGTCIINTASASAYLGDANFIDYAATAGAILAFTDSLALQLARRGIRVNAVAPDPADTDGVAGTYIFLATMESGRMSGQVVRPHGTVGK